ncbi:antigen 5 like allergen Cul n 1-like [Ochlerotatus camptorhynchus]|uniref:antigen 5 like allergen Cul n 1-like n=1 Tax=Ochlerotatus camptorhynchus TaxID=644619 RepID=UPI0031D65B2C
MLKKMAFRPTTFTSHPATLAIIFAIIVNSLAYKTQDYCAKGLCSRDDKKHIGCNTNRKFASTCDKPKLIPMSTKRKNLLLMIHNRLRNKVAKGKLSNFKPASNMSLMIWDDELAYLAELNVMQCEMKHDECRSTARFKYAGQNLARSWTSGPLKKHNENIRVGILGWFSEHKDASMKFIRKYGFTSKTIGHFTALVRDVSSHVGCAMSAYRKTRVVRGKSYNGNEFLLACNYANTNILKEPIYIEGKPCSACPGGARCHRVYTALCDHSD